MKTRMDKFQKYLGLFAAVAGLIWTFTEAFLYFSPKLTVEKGLGLDVKKPGVTKRTSPQVYIFCRNDRQKTFSKARAVTLEESGYRIFLKQTDKGPVKNELRFFHKAGEPAARQMASLFEKAGLTLSLKDATRFAVRRQYFELWYANWYNVSPKIYLFFRHYDQKRVVEKAVKKLEANGFRVYLKPATSGPLHTELRFFNEDDEPEARNILQIFSKSGVRMNMKSAAHFSSGSGYYEIWLSEWAS